MADKFLNFNGLTAFYNKIKALFANKVDKEIRTETDTSTHYIQYGRSIATQTRSKINTKDFTQVTLSDSSVVVWSGDSDKESRNNIEADGIYLDEMTEATPNYGSVLSARGLDVETADYTGDEDLYTYSNIKSGVFSVGLEDSETGTRTDSFALDGVNNTVSMNADLVTSFQNVLGISGGGGGGGGDYMVKGVDYVTAGQKADATLGVGATAEGRDNVASGVRSHAEGGDNVASGVRSHAEGLSTLASGDDSHTEGVSSKAKNNGAHAEGFGADASGSYSHAEGYNTAANRRYQHVFGACNIIDTEGENTNSKGRYVEIVGNGTTYNIRSNARTLDWNGNQWLAGTLKVGGTSYDDAKAVATEDNIAALQTQIDGLGEPFRVKGWNSSSLNVKIPSCTQDIANTSIGNMDFSISDTEGADYQIVGMIAYEVFDANNTRINCWPVCQFTQNTQKTLRVRWMCGGTSNKTAKSIKAWVLLKHR